LEAGIRYNESVDARPILHTLARALQEHRLEAVLIGNAAGALQGAPVTTVDFDFLFRKTPANLRKLKAVAKSLGAVVLRPYYPASDLFRLMRDDDSLQVDFMTRIHGIRSLRSLRSRATPVSFGSYVLLVADLSDIVRSKRAAGRPRDRAVLEILERTLDEKRKNQAEKA
jgi:predicted nucleotidyltransferase